MSSSRKIIEPSRTTPVVGEYDVVVVGGGPAGLMSAIAAASGGLSTLLVERYGFLGGAGTMGGLSTFCGLHARVHGDDRRVVRGFTDELLDRLDTAGGLSAPHLTIEDRILAQAFDISVYKKIADEIVLDHGGTILFHATAVGVSMAADDRIDAVIVESKSGRQAIRGRIFIDGSGDADLAAWSGAPYEVSESLLYPSLMFRINNVDPVRAGQAWKSIARLMDEAEAAGTHRFPRKKPLVRPQRNPIEWRSNITQLSNEDGAPIDGTNVLELTHGEIEGRRQSFDAFDFIRRNQVGFEDAYIVDLAPQIGVRETRRIVGPYQLTEDDILDCVDFEDTIGVNGWPVEAHVEGDVVFRFPHLADTRGFNQMPFRTIVPQRIANLYVVGRCASMTQWGQSSARVTGGCFVMGQAAGTAAAIALHDDVAVGDIDVAELQRRLDADGAYLGTDLAPDVVRASAAISTGA
ncbi:FAD-dependent oxidoreductase [Microbacterium sp. 18062]|uniref:FAD-dependent oxidoreductase n=1 Tax=Microbacterium sp. 18062 TaxID=2681410 RepID=UPI00135803C8|nr:FAD-dependent oxidoreductase [Microbacterium sp. 18062]